MYKSPIEIIYGEMEAQVEGMILKAVQKVGVDIDKEELICALRYDRGQYDKGYQDAKQEQRWIPVTERMPEGFLHVIVCREDGKVEQGFKDVNDWWKVYGTRTKHVTHWMPLPEPPKE